MDPAISLQLHPEDNVRVALRSLTPGEEGCSEAIPAKHKFTTEALAVGDPVTMYGVLVGKATKPIPAGGLIAVENLQHAAEPYAVEAHDGAPDWSPPEVSAWETRSFMGYRRASGRVGTANYWLVIPLVFCENRNLEVIRRAFARVMGANQSDPYERFVASLAESYAGGDDLDAVPFATGEEQSTRIFPGIDGLQFLSHEGGCGCDQGDAKALTALLAGYATHPNVAGVTVLSLGCQHTQVALLEEQIQQRDPSFDRPLLVFEEQSYHSNTAMLEEAIRETFKGMAEANSAQREAVPLGELCVGMECGGSDGFSGISSNPAMGLVADRLAALRGRILLAEFPELCGVEGELIQRCASRPVAERFAEIMEAYARRAAEVGAHFSMNPSPGNIADGLITDAIKSAGAARKGGGSPIVAALDYTEPADTAGLSLLCTPGNDVESTTALAGSGANLILFSTGLGTPTGNPVCPVIKISSNHATAEKHADFIDFDAGGIIEGTQSLEQAADALMELCITIASGQPSLAMQRGQHDFIPWKRGISL